MHTKLPRKDFIKLAAMGAAGLYFSSCSRSNNPNTAVSSKTKAQLASPAITSTDSDVIFYTKGDAPYEQLRHGFNKRINKFPAVIALCKTSAGVATAIERARKSGLPVAVKSGGHCMEGFSVNDGGMVINLSAMNGVGSVTSDGLVKIGPGAKLMEVYDALFPQNRLLPAGSCGTVGIGGLALGGGYGFFSRQYGLTCDHLSELTMIDGKGNLHHAKGDDELMWACRGGGSGNFGVVTEMIFRTHEAPAQFRTHRFRAFKVDGLRVMKILEQWFSIGAKLPLSCFSAFVLNGKTAYILLTNFTEHTPEVQAVVDAFTALTDKASNWQPMETAKALKEYYGSLQPVTFRNACAGLYKSFNEIAGFLSVMIDKVIETPGMIYQLNTMGGNIQNQDFSRASAYPHRNKIFVSELQTYWDQPGDNPKLAAAFEEAESLFSANGITAQYCNYPYLGFKNWEQAYYGETYSYLQAVKNKYDPDNLIRHPQSVRIGQD